jgi:hypothetical protein
MISRYEIDLLDRDVCNGRGCRAVLLGRAFQGDAGQVLLMPNLRKRAVQPQASSANHAATVLARRHLQFAWWSLLCFLTLGLMLEAMHAFKVSWYLEPAFETRRLMWTLGHAHGTLLALIHAVFGVSVQVFVIQVKATHRWASPCLTSASFLLPGGFFLGGIFFYGGDPGMGIFLVPLGGVLLLIGVLLAALAMTWEG